MMLEMLGSAATAIDAAVTYGPDVVAVAAALAAVLPRGERAAGVLAGLRKFLDVLALNVGNARNAKR